jgi:acyl carrier protein
MTDTTTVEPLSKDIVRKILERIASESETTTDPDAIRPEMYLREDLGMDSMQAVSLSLDLEDALAIRLDDEDLTKLNTVQDVLDVVQAKLSQPRPE